MTRHEITNTPVLILGESHSTAIARAIDDDFQSNFTAIDVRKGADSSKINDNLFSGIRADKLVMAFGGTEYNILGLVESEPPFDFIWPPFGDFDPERSLIPATALEEMIRYRLESSLQRALQVRQQFDCPVFALAPPPPFLALDENAKLPSAFTDLLRAGVTPAAVRRKLYAVQCHVMREAYALEHIPFIAAPAAASDADGYLLRQLWNRDPTHGNLFYGRLVLNHLRTELNV